MFPRSSSGSCVKIHRVGVTIYLPRVDDGCPGQVEEGAYTLEDNTVTLVSPAGLTLRDRQGKAFSRKLGQGEDPRVVAGLLLK
jgi:hypothetical protein